ncbi:MAG TPA: SPFH domain-containing protein [Longimicrobiales bacterium]|nr:SPFH domain-containing protein [Longimicrobiales bacterium]
MGIFDKIRGEFIDVIEWTDDSGNTLFHRFERHGNEIKNGAQLTVREGQAAVFVDEGELADVFGPGMYTLETSNLPILSTLKGWKHAFESPFKAEVYFVSTRKFVDQKWGTKNPVTMRDAEFGPVRVRAFGTYAFSVADPAKFLREIVGTDGHFTTEEISDQIRNILVARFSDALAESGLAVLDMAAHYDELGGKLHDRVRSDLSAYGLELSALLVENISLPPEVEKALDERTSMGIVGDLSAYTRYKAATALGDAAKAHGPGGAMAAGGLGAGLGFAMASQIGKSMAPTPPPPLQPRYWVAVEGRQTGPFDADAMAEQVRSGALTRETLVWTEGMPEWAPAAEVEAVAKLFGPVPPPLPQR